MRIVLGIGREALRALAFFVAVFAAGYQLNEWHRANHHIERNAISVGVDLMCVRIAAAKAILGQDPYLFSHKPMMTRFSPEAWDYVRLRPDIEVPGYIYPPALLYLAPLLPPKKMDALYAMRMLSLTVFLAAALLVAFSRRSSVPLAGGAVLLLIVAPAKPFVSSLTFGQINLVLGAMLLVSLYLLEQPSRWARAAGYGLAAAGFWFKLVPLAFSGLRQLERPRRLIALAAAVSIGGILVYALNPTVFGQWLAARATIDSQAAASEGARYHGYNLSGLVESLIFNAHLRSEAILAARAGTLLGLMAALWAVYRSSALDKGYLCLLPLGVALFLAMPISWDHHIALYAVPVLVGLVATLRFWQGGALAYALAGLTALWILCPRLTFDTHDIFEVLAMRQTTLYALFILAVFIAGQLVHSRSAAIATDQVR